MFKTGSQTPLIHFSDVNKANSVKAKQYKAKASHSKAKVKASHKIKSCNLHIVIIISVNSYYCQLHGKSTVSLRIAFQKDKCFQQFV